VIHGGAGVITKENMSDETKENMSDEKEKVVTAVLNAALDAGEAVLKSGGSSMDAVEKTIMILENSEHFNAGKGAVFTNAGTNELDASFMYGATQNAGAVGGVSNIKNPITAARAVMEKSEHVLLTGKGAEAFAAEQGIQTIDPSYFHTDRRWESLERAKARDNKQTGYNYSDFLNSKYGTVGCVALDKAGNITAGTSTGGMTNKKYNRIGDSPIIGAGTYADNSTCGISCTGWGEYFIRYAVAYDVHARMAYGEADLATATKAIINEKLVEKGGTGGLIATVATLNPTNV